MKKQMAFGAVILLLFTAILTGCGQEPASSGQGIQAAATRTVVDCAGRSVEIPQTVDSVIPLNNALRMLCYVGAADKVVGVETGEKEHSLVKAYNWVYYDTWKDLPEVGEGGSGGYTPYTEQIVTLSPDVILCGYSKEDAEDLQNKTGIPVVVIHTGTLFEDDYAQSLRVIGEVCGKEARAEEVIQYIQEVEDDIHTRTKDVPDSDKPSVYTGAVSFKGGHGLEGTYTNFPIFTVMEANDVTSGLSGTVGGVIVDKEQILTWNPDIIFLDPNNRSLVEEDMQTNPGLYASLSAFQNQRVYTCLGYNWYHTNVEIALADCYYVASVLYPEQFQDIDPIEKAEEIFRFMLGSDTYYQELEAAGLGFGEIQLGE